MGGNELAFAGLFSSVEAQTAVLAMAGTLNPVVGALVHNAGSVA